MQIHGFQKTTLLDYPGHVAATIFFGGCNFCCPFCHNKDLVMAPNEVPVIPAETVLSVLHKRRGILDGVCITGGEPTLQPDLKDFIKNVKDMGYLIKLDTNGFRPDILKELCREGLIDYVAMDIKHTKEKYPIIANAPHFSITPIEESVEFLKNGSIPYEFRTTVVREFHKEEDFIEIGKWLDGASRYFLQGYKDSERVISPGFHSYTKEELEHFCYLLSKYVKNIEIRGVD